MSPRTGAKVRHELEAVYDPLDGMAGDSRMRARLTQPMRLGAAVIAALVLGLGVWAGITRLETGVTGAGEVRSQVQRQTLRAPREGGQVKQILVREGVPVRAGQPLLTFSDVEARAAVDVYQNQYDTLLAQTARISLEAGVGGRYRAPPELAARAGDARVAGLLRDQEFLYLQRLQVFESQVSVLRQRIAQLETQVAGLQAQVASVDEQRRLTQEELGGYRELNARGYAPTNLVRRYERTLAELAGRRAQLTTDVARTRQQIGETRLQMEALREERQSQAAEALEQSQARLADVAPRLATARQAFAQTVVRAPVNGYIFNLAQFTPGGVVGAGELLMEIVPGTSALTVTAMIRPEEVDQVRLGQAARVRLTGLNPRLSDELAARVTLVSRDRITNEQTGQSFFRVDVAMDPKELSKLPAGAALTPGMPAQVVIVQGQRSVLDFLISPITDTLRDAFREE
ncbi:HlyD family type I secretion periplasmic adaptor subunit [Phenylobacterium sp.]|jgi:HlyD family type I secretion membrane fusion protein|uniref:HlyD family type I secretion periplasmic adaptor subunit n=1 Tax=Phenylobacterium sp. TaxID=1871053 RepID=UPI002F956C7A